MNGLNFAVDSRKCLRCGACIRDCAPGILAPGEGGIPVLLPETESRCTRCQHCLAVCPVGAVSIFGRNPADSVPAGNLPAPEAMLNLIRLRRSCRSYRRENIDRETLGKLKEMLAWVPTGVNNHRLDFAFVDDLAVMDEIRASVNTRIVELMKSSPETLGGLVRYREQVLAGKDVIFRGAPHMVAVSAPEESPCPAYDPTIALSYFELYANSLGLGTVWCGLAAAMFSLFPELAVRVGIPAGYRLGYVMLFGPAAVRYPRATQPEPAAVHSVR